jgi:transposase
MPIMSRPRRSFSPEYRVEAAHRVIDGHRPVAEVARELDLHENLLHKWVREERSRMGAAAAPGWRAPDADDGALSGDERAELVRLRARVAEQAKDIAFLEKASAYFAAKHPR